MPDHPTTQEELDAMPQRVLDDGQGNITRYYVDVPNCAVFVANGTNPDGTTRVRYASDNVAQVLSYPESAQIANTIQPGGPRFAHPTVIDTASAPGFTITKDAEGNDIHTVTEPMVLPTPPTGKHYERGADGVLTVVDNPLPPDATSPDQDDFENTKHADSNKDSKAKAKSKD